MYAMNGLFDSNRPDLTLLDMMIMMGQNFTDEEKQIHKKVLEEKSETVYFNPFDEYEYDESGLDEEEYECDQYYC